MSTIQLPGLLTGIDTSSLIAQLMAAERRTLTLYEQRKTTWEDRKDALGELETKLSTFRTTVRALSDSQELRAFSAASSDSDILTAEATYNAFEGNHTIVVNQLAAAERWVHTAGLEYAEDYVGAGTFVYSYNHKQAVITTTATTTLEELAGLINNDADNPGVTASLLNYDDAYHLVLNGNDAGSDYAVSIDASSAEVWQSDSAFAVNGDNATLSTKITQLDQFGENPLEGGETISITGTNHAGVAIAQVDLAVTSNTSLSHIIDEINDAFDGVAKAVLENGKIVLTDNTAGASGLSMTLTYNANGSQAELTLPTTSVLTQGGAVTADLAGFASADFTETQSARDSQIRVDGFPAGDWITRSSNTIDGAINGVTLHLHDVTGPGGEQITLTRDIESVKEKVNTMITAYNEAVRFIKQKTGYNEALKTAGLLMGDYVVSSIRTQLENPLITQTDGFVQDIDSFLTPAHIGIDVDRDGYLSLDENAFDEAVAEDYAGVLAVIGANKTGSTDSNTVRFYGASSEYTAAGQYNVSVTVSGGAITAAQIKLASESAWRDASFSGNIVTGNLGFDGNGDPLYPENALQLSVDLSADGTFAASVNVKQGFAGAVEDALDKMLRASDGSIKVDKEHAQETVDNLADKIEAEEYRLERRESRLIARFARLERTLALLQNQMSALGLQTG